VAVIDPGTNTVNKVIPTAANAHPYGVAVSPDASLLYVTKEDDSKYAIAELLVINTATEAIIDTFGIGAQIEPFGTVAVSPDGTHVYAIGQGNAAMYVIALKAQ
jgi:DNA-binding beta-propeller fold protein YncE